jgi:hypothetical protein
MKKVAMVILLCGLSCAAMTGLTEGSYQKKLTVPTKIGGYLCSKGYAWFYRDGVLEGCTVEWDTNFGVARVPAGSLIHLTHEGKPRDVFLKHNTEIGGYRCRGGNWLLGPSEGAITLFYPRGSLELCWLEGDRQVQGIPCSGSNMFSGDSGVQFYESGRLQVCKLSQDFGGFRRGQRFEQSQ